MQACVSVLVPDVGVSPGAHQDPGHPCVAIAHRGVQGGVSVLGRGADIINQYFNNYIYFFFNALHLNRSIKITDDLST